MFHQVGRIGSRLAIPFKRRNARLWLDFTSGNQKLDSRITFSRASNATVVGKDGTIQYAPHNLLTYSEQFDNAVWMKGNATVAVNAIIAPDGTLTAEAFNDTVDVSNSAHQLQQAFTATAGTPYRVSIYAKSGTGSGISLGAAGSGAFSAEQRVFFNTNTGVATTQLGTPTGNTMTDVGNGWYRCSTVITPPSSGTVTLIFRLFNSAGAGFYQGDGTQFIYIWGAQLNVGALQPYYPTTVKNLLGYTQEFDNAGWTKSNSFIQTNQIRNNTMVGAVAGTPGTLPTNWTYSGGGLTANVIGIGVEAGINYIDIQFVGTATSGSSGLRFEGNSGVSASTGQTWNSSIFIRRVAGSTSGLAGGVPLGLNLTYLAPGVGSDSASTYIGFDSLEVAAISQNRVLATATGASTGITTIRPQVILGHTIGNHIDITLRIGLPQLVQGATAGDVVATYGTAKAVMYQAPDGTMSADKLVEDTATSFHRITPTAVTVVSGTTITTSVYAKAAERTGLGLFPYSSAAGSRFNLATGTVTSQDSGVTASIVSVGNGWFRCSASIVAPGTSAAPWILPLNASNATNYTGDGTSGIYIWGAQLSDSASLDPYVYNPGAAPSASAYYGPRFDYDPVTLQPKGLLIEEQRTNLLTYSEQFDNAAWSKTRSTVTANTAIAPDGTSTADSFAGDATTGPNSHSVQQGFSVQINTIYVLSFYVKAGNITQIVVRASEATTWGGDNRALFNLSTGSVSVTAGSFDQTSIIPVGNGWYRCVVAKTAGQTASGQIITINLVKSGTPFTEISASEMVYIWGAQLEAGAFPTSYIPTTSAQATRAADVATMTGTNFASVWNPNEGTVYVESTSPNSIGYIWTAMRSGTAYGPRIQNTLNGANVSYAAVDDAGSVVVSVTRTGLKSAFSYANNDFAFVANGGVPITDNSGSVPTSLSQLRLGSSPVGDIFFNGWVKRLAYYPKRLSNTELQALTS